MISRFFAARWRRSARNAARPDGSIGPGDKVVGSGDVTEDILDLTDLAIHDRGVAVPPERPGCAPCARRRSVDRITRLPPSDSRRRRGWGTSSSPTRTGPPRQLGQLALHRGARLCRPLCAPEIASIPVPSARCAGPGGWPPSPARRCSTSPRPPRCSLRADRPEGPPTGGRKYLMWCSNAVNLGASLSLRATSRTRSNAFGASGPALCPGRVLLVVFPASPLPSSTTSAAADVASFGGFTGTTGLSDFPPSFISGVRPQPSLSGLPP